MFPLPLTVTLQPSRRLRHALLGFHLLAIGALGLAAIPILVQWALTLGLLASTWHATRPKQPIRIRCHQDGRLEKWANGAWVALEWTAPPIVMPGLTRLGCQPATGGPGLNIVLGPDSGTADELRRLRVWLRWRTPRSPAAPAPDFSGWPDSVSRQP